MAMHRCHVNDRPGAPLYHVPQCSARHQEIAVQVEREQALPQLEIKFVRRYQLAAAGIVDEYIETPETIGGKGDRSFRGHLVGNVQVKKAGIAADPRRQCLSRLCGNIRDDNLGTFLRHRRATRFADTACTASDQYDLVCQSRHKHFLVIILE